MSVKKLSGLLFIIVFFIAGCKYEYSGKLLRVDKVWLGYVYDYKEPETMTTVKSNVIYKVAGVGDDLYIATKRGFQFSTDKGETWQSSATIGKSVVTNFFIDPVSSDVYLCSEAGLYKKNPDYTFSKVDVDGEDIVATAVFVDEDNILYVGTKTKGLFITTDGGTTWIQDAGLKLTTDEEEDAPIDKAASNFIPYDITTHGVDANDPADPRNPKGLIRIHPYYRGERLSPYVTSVYVHNDIIYVGSDDGGVSFVKKTSALDSTTWNQGVDMLDWETYIAPYFRYYADSRTVRDDRSAETYWTIGTRNINAVYANDEAIFVATPNRGIAVTVFPDNAEQLENTYGEVQETDIYGSKVDIKGNSEYEMDENGRFVYNTLYGIGIDNKPKKVQRFSWAEYNTSGLSVYTPEGKIPPIPPTGQKLPSNNVKSIRFGRISRRQGKTPYNLIYACTPSGLAVAHYKRDTGGSVVISSSSLPWSHYHKDPTTIGESTRANDVYITKDADGDDEYVYLATDGQGLIRLKWTRTWMDKIRVEGFEIYDELEKM
ncbi:MAG: hypothetical protein JXR63_13185 [Spirochaetales bacterium]|nr:hypothetical protein [Spirochaetales bacterium]